MTPGTTVAQLDAELKAVKRRLNPAYPSFKRDWGVQALGLQAQMAREARPLLIALGAAVTLVLLIACANIANLLLARAWLREREVALRAALGAGSARLARQLLTESAVLALIGGAAGLGLASLAIGVLEAQAIDFLPPAMLPKLDLRVAGFAVLVSLLTGLLFGALPAWRARRPNLVDAMRRDGPTATARRPGGQAALVVGQVALTVVLLVAAGLFGRSLMRAVTADPGFAPERVLAFDLSLPDATYPNPESRLAFSKAVLERLRAVPGVHAAGTAMGIPFAGGGYGEFLSAVPQPQRGDLVIGRVDYVSDGFFEALGARLRSGRFLTADDNRRDARRVAVVNQAVVRQFFRNIDPVGRTIYFNGPYEIVGVIDDVVDRRLDLAHAPRLYTVQARNPFTFSIVVGDGRRSGDARAGSAAGGPFGGRRCRRGEHPHAGAGARAVDDRSPAGRLGRRAVRDRRVDPRLTRRLRRHGRCGERPPSRAVPADRARRQPQSRHPIGRRRRARPRRRGPRRRRTGGGRGQPLAPGAAVRGAPVRSARLRRRHRDDRARRRDRELRSGDPRDAPGRDRHAARVAWARQRTVKRSVCRIWPSRVRNSTRHSPSLAVTVVRLKVRKPWRRAGTSSRIDCRTSLPRYQRCTTLVLRSATSRV